jgi:hypothetical protein
MRGIVVGVVREIGYFLQKCLCHLDSSFLFTTICGCMRLSRERLSTLIGNYFDLLTSASICAEGVSSTIR